MLRPKITLLSVGLLTSFVLQCPALVVGAPRYYQQGERYYNDTGSAARCLVKYLYKWDIPVVQRPDLGQAASYIVKYRKLPSVWSDAFGNCTVRDRLGLYTVLECREGTVTSGGMAGVWFSGTAMDGEAAVVSAEWYSDDACTQFIGEAIPVPSLKIADDVPVPAEEQESQEVQVVIRHRSRDWDTQTDQPGDPLGIIVGSEIYFATAHGDVVARPLNEDLWTCHDVGTNTPQPGMGPCSTNAGCGAGYTCGPSPGITWQRPGSGPPTFSISYGDEVGPFHLGLLSPTERVIFRYYTDAVGAFGQSNYEVVQFQVRDLTIPAMSEWGFVATVTLLATAGTIVLIQRRTRVASCRAGDGRHKPDTARSGEDDVLGKRGGGGRRCRPG